MSQIDPTPMTPDEEAAFVRRRKSRNILLFGALLGWCILVYVVALVRMGSPG